MTPGVPLNSPGQYLSSSLVIASTSIMIVIDHWHCIRSSNVSDISVASISSLLLLSSSINCRLIFSLTLLLLPIFWSHFCNNTGIPTGPRVLGPVSEVWDRSLNSGVGTPEFWGTSDAFCVKSAWQWSRKLKNCILNRIVQEFCFKSL